MKKKPLLSVSIYLGKKRIGGMKAVGIDDRTMVETWNSEDSRDWHMCRVASLLAAHAFLRYRPTDQEAIEAVLNGLDDWFGLPVVQGTLDDVLRAVGEDDLPF